MPELPTSGDNCDPMANSLRKDMKIIITGTMQVQQYLYIIHDQGFIKNVMLLIE